MEAVEIRTQNSELAHAHKLKSIVFLSLHSILCVSVRVFECYKESMLQKCLHHTSSRAEQQKEKKKECTALVTIKGNSETVFMD